LKASGIGLSDKTGIECGLPARFEAGISGQCIALSGFFSGESSLAALFLPDHDARRDQFSAEWSICVFFTRILTPAR
jgi:hypothetical protein